QDRDLAVVLTPIVVEEPEIATALVVVERRRIVILEKVLFETAKAVIRPESFELLDQVSQIIVDNPQVGRVEVGGHTDSRGSDRYNLELSQRRSDAVRAFLIRRGVTEDRLIAVGIGEERPIDDNETDEGREANRRVEFNLIDVPEDDEPIPDERVPATDDVQETP
ncbi:MAG: OOP family OmpA-OmpF porin, partial [bacterium]